MAYFLDLFSPETYEAFSRSDRKVSGFRFRQKNMAERVKVGDIFVCYVTRLSRWCGLLQVHDGPFINDKPIFVAENDPFTVRFHVHPKVWFELDKSIPIHEDVVWDRLSFTQGLPKNTSSWTGVMRSSLRRMDDGDGKFIAGLLNTQAAQLKSYPLEEAEKKKLTSHKITRPDKVVTVSVPEDFEADETLPPETEIRESLKMQALLAQVGARMGLSIWIPKADRNGVLREWNNEDNQLLDRLPLNYDDTTLRTIEQIDVLWLRGRSIVRAFEVEHTTSVYSGILRMADLLALQPNMDIKLHIVAPWSKREKVFQEIRRPVFSLLEKGPLADSCTYLSYDSLKELASEKHLAHLSDTVLDEYVEEVE